MRNLAKSGWPVSGQRQVNSSVSKVTVKARPGRGLTKVSRCPVGRVTTNWGSGLGREALGAFFVVISRSFVYPQISQITQRNGVCFESVWISGTCGPSFQVVRDVCIRNRVRNP